MTTAPTRMSVVVPAHNESAVLGRLLRSLVDDDPECLLEIVVVANGCSDDTAQVAAAVAPRIRVVQIPQASKIAALNAGDAAARSFPRAYVDADVVVSARTLLALADALDTPGGPLVASPRLVVDVAGSSWFLRAHYRIWELSDYRLEGHVGSGIYALSRDGRSRFGEFPDVIADDRFVQQRFALEERASVGEFTVRAPRTLRAHIRRATRISRGNQQLPDALQHAARVPARQRYTRLAARVLPRPSLWPAFVVYGVGYATPQVRARWQTLLRRATRWDRDETSRAAPAPSLKPTPGDRSLTVLYSFPHAFGAPGIGWTAWNQVNELVRAGHRVHLATTSVDRPVPGLASLTLTLTVRSTRVPHRVLGRDRALAWHDVRVARMLATTEVDVVHGWPLAFLRTAAAAGRHGIPAVREVPNTHTEHAYVTVAEELRLLGMSPPKASPHTANPQRLAVESREWDGATALLVPSEAVARTFLDRGFPDARLLRHQYGYQPARFEHVDIPESRPDRPFTAVYLGRLEPRKGLHYALEAWRDSSAATDGRFVVYGEPVPGYLEVIRHLLDQPGVELHPFTRDVAGAFAAADVMLLPTIEEGSALVTYEAQAAGCVPLVSAASGALLDDGVHGLVHPARDVSTLGRQLTALHDDAALLARMRSAVLAHRTALTWESASERVVAAYRSAAATVGGGSRAHV